MKKIILIALSLGFCCYTQTALAENNQVQNVEATSRLVHKISLQWQAVSGADYYQVRILNKNKKYLRKVRANENHKVVTKLKEDRVYFFRVRARVNGVWGTYSNRIKARTKKAETNSNPTNKIIYLHHSTGENIWNGGVESALNNYNSANNTSYQITEQAFPKDSPYGWNNYPYDYWNIWVNHAGSSEYQEEPTLEILTASYDVIVFKHCFPVSYIEPNVGADISSDYKSIENYKLQYNALKEKMHEFSNNKFIVWTGAALTQNSTDAEHAQRAQEFFDWVKNEWDEENDNIFVWDFWQLETDGGIYMKDEYASDPYDSHPDSEFAQTVAPYFVKRLTDVMAGNGDSTSITGQ